MKANINSLPAVKSVTLTHNVAPFVRIGNGWTQYTHEGEEWLMPTYWTDEAYAKVMEIPLLEGHWMGEQPGPTEYPPAVVNEVVAQRFLGGGVVIGKTFTNKENAEKFTVVGVIGPYKHFENYSWEDPAVFVRVSDRGIDKGLIPNQILVKYQEGENIPALLETLEKTIQSTVIPGGVENRSARDT